MVVPLSRPPPPRLAGRGYCTRTSDVYGTSDNRSCHGFVGQGHEEQRWQEPEGVFQSVNLVQEQITSIEHSIPMSYVSGGLYVDKPIRTGAGLQLTTVRVLSTHRHQFFFCDHCAPWFTHHEGYLPRRFLRVAMVAHDRLSSDGKFLFNSMKELTPAIR